MSGKFMVYDESNGDVDEHETLEDATDDAKAKVQSALEDDEEAEPEFVIYRRVAIAKPAESQPVQREVVIEAEVP